MLRLNGFVCFSPEVRAADERSTMRFCEKLYLSFLVSYI